MAIQLGAQAWATCRDAVVRTHGTRFHPRHSRLAAAPRPPQTAWARGPPAAAPSWARRAPWEAQRWPPPAAPRGKVGRSRPRSRANRGLTCLRHVPARRPRRCQLTLLAIVRLCEWPRRTTARCAWRAVGRVIGRAASYPSAACERGKGNATSLYFGPSVLCGLASPGRAAANAAEQPKAGLQASGLSGSAIDGGWYIWQPCPTRTASMRRCPRPALRSASSSRPLQSGWPM